MISFVVIFILCQLHLIRLFSFNASSFRNRYSSQAVEPVPGSAFQILISDSDAWFFQFKALDLGFQCGIIICSEVSKLSNRTNFQSQ